MSSILPFSRQALLHLLSSDFLNPCAYELRHVEDKGSIKKTLEAAFPLLNNNCVDFISGRVERPIRPLFDKILRGIALSISALALEIFLPPLGALLHLSKVVVIVALNILRSISTLSTYNCSSIEIKQNLEAAKCELGATLINLLIFPLLITPLAVHCSAQHMTDCVESISQGPKRDMRVYQALSLRENFGIVAENGRICAWSLKDQGLFNGFYKVVSQDLLNLIASFNRRLSLGSEIRIPYHFPPSEEFILNHILQADNISALSPDEEFYESFIENLVKMSKTCKYFNEFFQREFYYRKSESIYAYFNMHLSEDSEVSDRDSSDESDSDSSIDLDPGIENAFNLLIFQNFNLDNAIFNVDVDKMLSSPPAA